MKNTLIILAALVWGLAANAYEINRGTTLTDGQTLYASDLHNLIDTAEIGADFYNNKSAVTSLGAGYYFLIYDPATAFFRRITAHTVLYGNTNFFITQTKRALPEYGLMMFYDPTNNVLGTLTASNLAYTISSNLNVATLKFATTNNSGATNRYVLPVWPFALSTLTTNYQAQFLAFDTNGVPYQLGYSNLVNGFVEEIGTNQLTRFQFKQVFKPWELYGTNAATNAFGLYTNFPITSLMVSNAATGTNGLATLTTNDTLPVLTERQGTNTTLTLGALLQFTRTNLTTAFRLVTTNGTGTAPCLVTNVAHGLGGVPNFVTIRLVCMTNDGTYIVGDELDIDQTQNSGDARCPFSWGVNSTNLWLTKRLTFNQAVKKDGTTGYDSVTEARWFPKIYAQ